MTSKLHYLNMIHGVGPSLNSRRPAAEITDGVGEQRKLNKLGLDVVGNYITNSNPYR